MIEKQLDELQEKETYLMEYEEMQDNEMEALPQPRKHFSPLRVKDFQLIRIEKIELPFFIVSCASYRHSQNTVIKFSGNEKFYIPSKEFINKLKEKRNCNNCC